MNIARKKLNSEKIVTKNSENKKIELWKNRKLRMKLSKKIENQEWNHRKNRKLRMNLSKK